MKKLLFTLLCAALLAGCSKNEGEKSKDAVYGKTFVENVSDLDMRMIFVEGGTFSMGATAEQEDDAYDWEYPVHQVTVSSFYISECPITQYQWYKIMGISIQDQASKAGSSSCYGVGPNYPMYYVSWEEAQEFCEKLSALTGKNYSLPTEAQWEYAARGGKKSKGYKYSGSNNIDEVAWYWDNSESKNSTSPVKRKSPNELGLYDMSGNVWEWCKDYWYYHHDTWHSNDYTEDGTGWEHVLRGGCWISGAQFCRVSYRYYNTPGGLLDLNGFRVVVLP